MSAQVVSLKLPPSSDKGGQLGYSDSSPARALGRPKTALAQRMHASGEPASAIATTLDVSRATVYRALAENAD
jgi:DNA invertase Pin-like site-specific DNA recombinase